MTAHSIQQQLEMLTLWAIRNEQRHLPLVAELEAVYFDGARFSPNLQKATKSLFAKHPVAAWWKQRLAEAPRVSLAHARAECAPLPFPY